MGFVLIKGTFHVVGYSPDGDSLKFMATNATHWNKLSGGTVKRNTKGHVQLRFEGIDTPETHYKGEHQPGIVANPATDYALQAAGIRNVVWTANRYRVKSADDGTPGYILSREAERYGRPVAFAFAGTTSKTDGSRPFLDTTWLKQSLNYQLVRAGWAYPTYYEGLFADLREALTGATLQAWNAWRGVWPYDWTDGVPVVGQASISDEYGLLPKLFRRLTAHFAAGGTVSGFKSYLATHEDRLLVLPNQHFTNLNALVGVSGNVVSLSKYPENFVFRP